MASEMSEEGVAVMKTDRYGFYEEGRNRKPIDDIQLENQRLKKWQIVLRDWDEYVVKKPEVIKRRIRKGIPDAVRGRVWCILLSADVFIRRYMQDILSSYGPSTDINRTYPNHEDFAQADGVGQEMLKRVLMAFADHDKEVKYTQGMNYIVGLLLNYMTEENAFWALRQIMENWPFCMSQWFDSSLSMLHASTFIMQALLQHHLPQLHAHLASIQMLPELYVTEWFMCVYTRSFPYDIVVRIWDIFLAEGWTIVYAVALALLHMNQKELIGKDFEEAFAFLSGLSHSDALQSADEIISMALAFHITDEEIQGIKQDYLRTLRKPISISQ